MNISYRAVGATGDYTLFFDDTQGGVLETFSWDGSLKVQQETLCSPPGATGAEFRQPIGNIKGTLPVRKWAMTYSTLDAALAAFQSVPAGLLGTKVNLRATQGATVLYFPNAVATGLKADMQGATVEFDGAFVTDQPTLTEPA